MEIKTYKVSFKPIYPVGGCLVINAISKEQALQIANDTVDHVEINPDDITEFTGVGVVEYLSGDY